MPLPPSRHPTPTVFLYLLGWDGGSGPRFEAHSPVEHICTDLGRLSVDEESEVHMLLDALVTTLGGRGEKAGEDGRSKPDSLLLCSLAELYKPKPSLHRAWGCSLFGWAEHEARRCAFIV